MVNNRVKNTVNDVIKEIANERNCSFEEVSKKLNNEIEKSKSLKKNELIKWIKNELCEDDYLVPNIDTKLKILLWRKYLGTRNRTIILFNIEFKCELIVSDAIKDFYGSCSMQPVKTEGNNIIIITDDVYEKDANEEIEAIVNNKYKNYFVDVKRQHSLRRIF